MYSQTGYIAGQTLSLASMYDRLVERNYLYFEQMWSLWDRAPSWETALVTIVNDSGDQYVDVDQIDDLIFLSSRRVLPFISFAFYLSFKEIWKTRKLFASVVDNKATIFLFGWDWVCVFNGTNPPFSLFALCNLQYSGVNEFLDTSIEKDHVGDWSPGKDCCYWLTFRQPVRKPSSESSGSVSQLKIQKPWWAIWLVSR